MKMRLDTHPPGIAASSSSVAVSAHRIIKAEHHSLSYSQPHEVQVLGIGTEKLEEW